MIFQFFCGVLELAVVYRFRIFFELPFDRNKQTDMFQRRVSVFLSDGVKCIAFIGNSSPQDNSIFDTLVSKR